MKRLLLIAPRFTTENFLLRPKVIVIIIFKVFADMAELVDAHVSGTCNNYVMGVQVSLSAF